MMRENKSDDAFLDDMFAAAKSAPLAPSDDLVTRVLADAALVQAEFSATGAAPRGSLRSYLRGLVDGLGGWPSVGGLAAAAMVGVWFGASVSEDLMSDASELAFGATSTLDGLYGDYAFLDDLGDR